MQTDELRRIFNLVNRKSPSNAVSRQEFELLLLTLLGFELTAHAIEACLKEVRAQGQRMDVNVGNGATLSVPFDVFLSWWTTTKSPYLENRSKK